MRKNLRWLATLGVPVAITAGAGLTLNNPVVMIASGLAAVVVTAIGAVGAGLWKRWHTRIIDHIDLVVAGIFSRYDHRYRSHVLKGARFVETKGQVTVGPFTPELADIYVHVSLAYRSPHQVQEGIVAQVPADVIDRHCIWDFLDKPEPRILAVVGVPGSGKTTLLRHTARVACEKGRGGRTLPLLLYLRDHSRTIVENPVVTLPELIRHSLAPYEQLTEPVGWFEQRLRAGACIVLLDGLDEVGRVADRTEVAGWVDRQTRQYANNDFVLTSRPQGYRTAPIDGATVLQVRAFTNDQVRRLVRGWYLAAERHSTGESGPDVELRATTESSDLLERLDATPGLYDLTVNPLLLTMIANVHRFRGALPGSRVELYSEMCQVMLCRRQEAKKLTAEISGEKKEGLLRRLAFTMMERRVRDLPRAEVIAEIEPALRRMPGKLAASTFLEDVGSNGLLVERESGQYAFAHLTFQEYLAASHLRDIGNGHLLAAKVDDIWWRETTLLYAARSNADPIVSACLDSPSGAALSLAFDCADEDSDMDPKLRDRLESMLANVASKKFDAERRLLVSQALVTRLLHHVRHTEGGGRVCVQPVPVGIYRLFLQDTGNAAPDRQRATRFNEPATGMWAADAVAFVRWLNGITGGEPACRLPTRAELDDHVVQHARKSLSSPPAPAWILPPEAGAARPAMWAPSSSAKPAMWTPDNDHPHQVDVSSLTECVVRDLTRQTPILTRLLLLHSQMLSRLLDDNRDKKFARVVDYFDPFDNLNSYLRRTYDQVLEEVFHPDKVTTPDNQDSALASALKVAQLLTTARRHGFTRGGNLHFATGAASELARGISPTPDRGLLRALDHALDLDRTRVPRLFRTQTIAAQNESSFAEVIGTALSNSLTKSIARGPSADDWPTTFATVFAAETGAYRKSHPVSLDSISIKLRTLAKTLQKPCNWLTGIGSDWPEIVVRRLLETATPIFDRTRPLDDDTATAIRVPALCLAVEAEVHALELGSIFREIAAGVTLLQGRKSGAVATPETIVLATD